MNNILNRTEPLRYLASYSYIEIPTFHTFSIIDKVKHWNLKNTGTYFLKVITSYHKNTRDIHCPTQLGDSFICSEAGNFVIFQAMMLELFGITIYAFCINTDMAFLLLFFFHFFRPLDLCDFRRSSVADRCPSCLLFVSASPLVRPFTVVISHFVHLRVRATYLCRHSHNAPVTSQGKQQWHFCAFLFLIFFCFVPLLMSVYQPLYLLCHPDHVLAPPSQG